MEGLARIEEKGKNIQNVAYKGHKDGSVEFYGDQVEALTGYTKDDFNNRRVKWTDIVFSEDKEQIKRAFVQALKSDKTYMREYRIVAKSGDVRWIREWGQIVCDEGGEIEYITGILVDIVEEKRIEAARLRVEQMTGKYLTFSMADELFGIGILSVKEIIGMMPITSVPQTPNFVKGVINLRGKVIPVIDLRLRFGMEAIDYTERTCIIVVEIQGKQGQMVTGIVVDSVSEVLNIKGEEIEDTPTFGTDLNTDYILGMAKTEGDLKILLDINRVLSSEEIALLNTVA